MVAVERFPIRVEGKDAILDRELRYLGVAELRPVLEGLLP
jgi:hypothetical protein